MDEFRLCLLFFLLFVAVAKCKYTNGWPKSKPFGASQTNWTGNWSGVIEAYPEGEMGAGWTKTLEIGDYPMANYSCTTLRGIMKENDTVRITKDYRLCRGRGADDLYIDQGDATLAVQWMNDVLVAPFKFNGVFAVSRLRMRGDILEEEIVITDDTPAVKNVLVSVRARSLHLIQMRRISASNIGRNLFPLHLLCYIGTFLVKFAFD
ncbi:unnamed protein product [Adineta steineri]|uniref:Uncharacterized protein n=1 Tax=Adineta steineri TaxID=433720 RepID=A0A813VP97_9BILA|nr:unnamed protein product [Adineta steineri]CAF1193544.1 unnamed protein product [Adineta steineri]CAF1270716.1 unnamed protein product [Adineta steineri]CAF1533551.1 unnamed protein product [Adineta steineri]